MFYIVKKIVIAIACYVDICAIWAWVVALGADNITAIATVFIAVCALGVTLWQGWETRKNNRLSLRPLLRFESTESVHDGVGQYKFFLVNRGVGPAIIESFILFSDDGKESYSDFESQNKFLNKKMEQFYNTEKSYLGHGSIMDKGEKQILWEFEYNPYKQNLEDFAKLKISIEYKSIYQDEIMDLHRSNKVPVNAAKVPIMPPVSTTAINMANIHALCFTVPRPWTVDGFTNLLKSPGVFDIKHEGGFAIGQHLDKTQTELLTLAIIPYEQGKGHGRDLLNQFIAEVVDTGRKSIFLEVAENNTSALHLYEKAGFKRVGLRPAHYEAPNAPNIDAILMRLDIKTP
ncbi:MAG: GNAT family N-acetyltransferase [Candidatus Halichondribacter symbioticus]